MALDIATSLPLATLVILAGKWYHDHMTLKEIRIRNLKTDKQITAIEKENLRIIEALERTYVSKEYIFKCISCGYKVNPDVQASSNILNKGLQSIGVGITLEDSKIKAFGSLAKW